MLPDFELDNGQRQPSSAFTVFFESHQPSLHEPLSVHISAEGVFGCVDTCSDLIVIIFGDCGYLTNSSNDHFMTLLPSSQTFRYVLPGFACLLLFFTVWVYLHLQSMIAYDQCHSC